MASVTDHPNAINELIAVVEADERCKPLKFSVPSVLVVFVSKLITVWSTSFIDKPVLARYKYRRLACGSNIPVRFEQLSKRTRVVTLLKLDISPVRFEQLLKLA